MMFQDIIEKCHKLSVYEERSVTDTYYEVVFYNQEEEEWNRVLATELGEAVKPKGSKPNKDHLVLTKKFGGVWVDQTLFLSENDDCVLVAMLWPWQDGMHTTLKMACVKSA